MNNLKTNIPKDRKLYGNCQVISPDGHLMFRCDNKKANWYISRELAYIVNKTPLTIKLKFEPRGLGNHNKTFGLSLMSNKCVNCGTEDYLSRHHVVPHCYRKHFPLNMKSHNFHDVLSLCIPCHTLYERKADMLKLSLANEYNAPINGIIDLSTKGEIKAIKNCNTLLKDINGIPDERIKEIKKELCEYLGRDFTYEDLISISKSKYKLLKTHGEIVVSKISNIQDFIKIWRKHFIDNNECLFLPENWNIENIIIINE